MIILLPLPFLDWCCCIPLSDTVFYRFCHKSQRALIIALEEFDLFALVRASNGEMEGGKSGGPGERSKVWGSKERMKRWREQGDGTGKGEVGKWDWGWREGVGGGISLKLWAFEGSVCALNRCTLSRTPLPLTLSPHSLSRCLLSVFPSCVPARLASRAFCTSSSTPCTRRKPTWQWWASRAGR